VKGAMGLPVVEASDGATEIESAEIDDDER
jgi:hypothetical protein